MSRLWPWLSTTAILVLAIALLSCCSSPFPALYSRLFALPALVSSSSSVRSPLHHASESSASSWNILYHLGGNGPWIPRLENGTEDDLAPPHGCRVDQVHMVGLDFRTRARFDSTLTSIPRSRVMARDIRLSGPERVSGSSPPAASSAEGAPTLAQPVAE